MGNKKSRQDLLGYDLSSDTDETDKEEEEHTEILLKHGKESPEITLTSSPDIMSTSQVYPDVLTTSQQYPDILTSSNQYPDLITSSNQYPDLMTSSNQYPDLMTSSKQYPDLMTSSKHYAKNLRMFEATRSKDPDKDTDILDLTRLAGFRDSCEGTVLDILYNCSQLLISI